MVKSKLLQFVKNNWGFLAGFILSFILLWPLFKAPYFTHHDDVQIIRLYEMDKCVKDLQIPCRWVPDLGGLYGYPLFNYYGPLPYYFGEVVYLISSNLIISAKAMFVLAFLASYVFMYLLGKELWGKVGGAISGIFYSYAPYHAADFYVRGAMGEMWALMLFPAIFWAILLIYRKLKIKYAILLGVFIALLAISHNLSVIMFMPFALIFILVLFLANRQVKFLKLMAFSFMIGIGLSAFYWLPAIAESKLVHLETTTIGYFSYTEHFKGLRKLFFEKDWNWGPSIREFPGSEPDAKWYHVGFVHTAAWLLAMILAYLSRKRKKFIFVLIFLFSASTLAAVFMVHPRSIIVWQHISYLKYLQFPWRFLLVIAFFTSLIAGSLGSLLDKKYLYYISLILVGSVIFFDFSFFRPERFLNVSQNDLLTGLTWEKQIKRSIFDYLPIYAKLPPAELANERYEITQGLAKIEDFRQGSNWFDFTAITNLASKIKISQYYFPEWEILANGQKLNIDYNTYLGIMSIELPKGEYKIEGKLYDTPIRKFGNLITILSTIVVGIVLLKRKAEKAK